MAFEYHWKHKEASFGPPIEGEVPGGTHITFEIILKKGNKYIALRRPQAIPEHELPPHAKEHPEGMLFFCHNLIRYGESVEQCVKRIVKDQAGANVKNFRVFYMESFIQEKDKQWALIPHAIAEVDSIPKPGIYGNKVTEVVTFTKDKIPKDFAWWNLTNPNELKELLEEYD